MSTNKKISNSTRRSLIAIGINLAAIIAVAIIAVVVVTSRLGAYTHHGEAVRVPAVVGMDDAAAVAALTGAGLKPMIIDSVYADARPGAVIEQLPEGDLPIKLGRIVYLTINAHGTRMVKMSDVHEWSRRQATSHLSEVGFTVDSVRYIPYEFDDLVVDVNLASGATAEVGREYPFKTHVVLQVGSTTLELEARNDSTEVSWFE